MSESTLHSRFVIDLPSWFAYECAQPFDIVEWPGPDSDVETKTNHSKCRQTQNHLPQIRISVPNEILPPRAPVQRPTLGIPANHRKPKSWPTFQRALCKYLHEFYFKSPKRRRRKNRIWDGKKNAVKMIFISRVELDVWPMIDVTVPEYSTFLLLNVSEDHWFLHIPNW